MQDTFRAARGFLCKLCAAQKPLAPLYSASDEAAGEGQERSGWQGDSERVAKPLLAESMYVAEPARNFLRRTFCAACGAEFFLYEKMGKRAIDHAENTSEAGGRALAPVPTP